MKLFAHFVFFPYHEIYNQVAKLTRVRLYQVYMGLLGSGTLPSLSPHSALGALLPRIEASAAQLHRLARVNRDVYLGFYLDIVG